MCDLKLIKFAQQSHKQVMKKQIYSTMKGNLQRRHVMARLHLFPEEVCRICHKIIFFSCSIIFIFSKLQYLKFLQAGLN